MARLSLDGALLLVVPQPIEGFRFDHIRRRRLLVPQVHDAEAYRVVDG